MRDAFIRELTTLATEHENIVLVVGDLGYGVVERFAEAFPDRFFNAGVAEQNMMSMCAGLASEGAHVFAYSIANFSTFRCAEQIRNDVDYHRLPVTVVAVGGGLAYGNLGYSHHAVQDFALMRSFPNMLIAAPGDPHETVSCTRYLVAHPQPSYLRLGRGKDELVHSSPPQIEPGIWVPVSKGTSNALVLTTGGALRYARMALKRSGDSTTSLFSLPLWSANHKALQPSQIEQWAVVETAEDHLLDGGFGSWLMEATVTSAPELLGRIRPRGIPSALCGVVGSQDELMNLAGLAHP